MSQIAAEFHFPGMTADQYDQLIKGVDAAEADDPSLSEGRVIHVAMPEDGGWFVFDVWESEDALGKMGAVLGPLFTKHGFEMAQPKVYPVHHTMR